MIFGSPISARVVSFSNSSWLWSNRRRSMLICPFKDVFSFSFSSRILIFCRNCLWTSMKTSLEFLTVLELCKYLSWPVNGLPENFLHLKFHSFSMILNIYCKHYRTFHFYSFLFTFRASNQQVQKRFTVRFRRRIDWNLRTAFFIRSNKELEFCFQINSTANFILTFESMRRVIYLVLDKIQSSESLKDYDLREV